MTTASKANSSRVGPVLGLNDDRMANSSPAMATVASAMAVATP